MAFRKRNIAVGRSPLKGPTDNHEEEQKAPVTGVRPSTISSHIVTSTGTPSLDSLLGGHNGLPLGSTLLIEASGTTDFAGALLRYFAAEGFCHGHIVHVVGVGEGWVRELPGVVDGKGREVESKVRAEEKMKIAWRYEKLGQAGERAPSDRNLPAVASSNAQTESLFCHTFDLSKRLTIPTEGHVNHIRITPSTSFETITQSVAHRISLSPPNSVHRLVIPSILNPALYPANFERPENLLSFFRNLRALTRLHPNQLTAMVTLPLELYPRSAGLVRWAEILSDGVMELTPFPHLMDSSNSLAESGGSRAQEDQPQGLVKFHKLPIISERGEGGAGAGNSMGQNLAFTVSRRKFVIKPFSLPPLEGDQDAQEQAGKLRSKDIEF